MAAASFRRLAARPAPALPLALACTLGAAAALAGPQPAAAAARRAGPEAEAEAHERFSRGKALFTLGKYREAITEFEKVYEVLPKPAVLFNLAQSYRFLGEYKRAIFFFEAFLRESRDRKAREAVEALLVDMRAALEKTKKPAEGSGAGAREPGKRPPPDAPPPPARPPASAPEAGGGGDSADLGLPRPDAAAPADPAFRPGGPESEPADRRPRRGTWWIWVTVGAVVLAGGAVAAALLARPSIDIPDSTLGVLDGR